MLQPRSQRSVGLGKIKIYPFESCKDDIFLADYAVLSETLAKFEKRWIFSNFYVRKKMQKKALHCIIGA